MFELSGYRVRQLERISFGPLTLTGLRRGEWRFLTKKEINMLKKYIAAIETTEPVRPPASTGPYHQEGQN